MARRKPQFCKATIALTMENGEIRGNTCNRSLPCLLHTPYEPDYPRAVFGPRPALAAEIIAGTHCRRCIRCVAVHEQRRPHEVAMVPASRRIDQAQPRVRTLHFPPFFCRKVRMKPLIFLSTIFLSTSCFAQITIVDTPIRPGAARAARS